MRGFRICDFGFRQVVLDLTVDSSNGREVEDGMDKQKMKARTRRFRICDFGFRSYPHLTLLYSDTDNG